MNTLLLEECKSQSDFFTRFDMTEEEIQSYQPIILCLTYSYGGECAESYGFFINKINHCIYYISGSECSIWDFNGQFQPELLSYQQFENSIKQLNLNSEEVSILEDILSKSIINKEAVSHLNNDYLSYFDSWEITDKYINILNLIDKDTFLTIFNSHLITIEDNISFYKFEQDYGIPQTFFITFSPHIKLYKTDNTNTFSEQFLSDLIGSLEINEDIFSQPNSKKMKV